MTDTVSARPTAPTHTRSFGWQALDSARDQRFTGTLVIDVGGEIRLFFDLGVLYFAERTTDPALADRLLAIGVVTADELECGLVHVGDVAHYGRLFDRVPTIDRDTVVTTIELMNSEIVGWMASREVLAAEALPYRHHPSGIQRWMDTADPIDDGVVDPVVDVPDPAIEPTLAGSAATPAGTGTLPPPPPMSVPTLAPPLAEPDVSDLATVAKSAEPEPIGRSLADVIELTPRIVNAEPLPQSPPRTPADPTPIGPDAATGAHIASTEQGDGPSPPATESLIRPLVAPGGHRRIDTDGSGSADQAPPPTEQQSLAAIPNLPTGAERRTPRDLAISTGWTVGLGLSDDHAPGASDAPDADQPEDDPFGDDGGIANGLERDEPSGDSSGPDLSIHVVWPSGAVDPRSSDDALASGRRRIERPTPGGSARLAVGRSGPDTDSAGNDAHPVPASTAASEAVVFEIDWSLGALPPPAVAVPEDQVDAADVLDDVMHAVRRTVAACETRVARTQEPTRAEQVGSLAGLGGVIQTQPARSVFDDVMTPSFAGSSVGGQADAGDRSGALRRLIGSLKRP